MKVGAWKRTNANVKRILDLFDSGETCAAIATIVKANPATVGTVVRASGRETRTNMRRVVAAARRVYPDEIVRECVQAGIRGDVRATCEKLGIGTDAAYAITRRRGLILGCKRVLADPNIKKLICDLYEIGVPTREITAKAHCSQGTIMAVVGKSGLPRRRPGAIGRSRRKIRDDGIGSEVGD